MAYTLFFHGPSKRWVPLVLSGKLATPGSAYIPELAVGFKLDEKDIEVVERDVLPEDFEETLIPRPSKPRTPEEIERDEAREQKLPPFNQLEADIETLFADHTREQRAYLLRLVKLIRVLSERLL